MINYFDLFSGIGGFALGAYMAGMRFDNHFYSEIDKYCIQLYKKRFSDSVFLGDINKIDFEKLKKDYPGDWIITGGFPCQDISIAGKGAGIEGSRSGLWFEMWRAIRILRPRFVIAENVGAITFRGLDRVLSSLAEIGYNAEWQDIRAEDVGAPHRRERIWIVAYPSSTRTGNRTGKTEAYRKWETWRNEQTLRQGNRKAFANRTQPTSETKRDVSYPSSIRCNLRGFEWSRGNGLADSYTKLSDSPIQGLEGEKSKGKSRRESGLFTKCGWWAVEPSVCSVVNGLPSGLDRYEGRLATKSYKRVDQLKGLGNAIVPQIAMILFLQIKKFIYNIDK